jgi:hypothetical protein
MAIENLTKQLIFSVLYFLYFFLAVYIARRKKKAVSKLKF